MGAYSALLHGVLRNHDCDERFRVALERATKSFKEGKIENAFAPFLQKARVIVTRHAKVLSALFLLYLFDAWWTLQREALVGGRQLGGDLRLALNEVLPLTRILLEVKEPAHR